MWWLGIPESASSSLHLEHHVVCDLFQVTYELRLTSGTCVFQGFYQPGQSRRFAILTQR
jgi:hypothetical protein